MEWLHAKIIFMAILNVHVWMMVHEISRMNFSLGARFVLCLRHQSPSGIEAHICYKRAVADAFRGDASGVTPSIPFCKFCMNLGKFLPFLSYR